MLQFYYSPFSPNARRVWITLLEKELEFVPIQLQLNGDQLQPEFLAVNPLNHIPVLVDEDFRIVESIAIMDYLNAKYPSPPLLPESPQAIATVRMAQLLTANELMPAAIGLLAERQPAEERTKIEQKANRVLHLFEDLLGNRAHFGGDRLSLGDIVAGVGVALLPPAGMSLDPFPTVSAWMERLSQRPAWQRTQLAPAEMALWQRRIRALLRLKHRQMRHSLW
jgi:glutathione S-transferase